MTPVEANAPGQGVSRRAFLRFCTLAASLLALPPGTAALMAEALSHARRLPVMWLWFQECTGCTESLTRSSAPSIEQLFFELISLDYHHTLRAAARAPGGACWNSAARGRVPRNACSTVRWNGIGNPVESGHPCIGCSAPGFWDRGRLYAPVQPPTRAPSGTSVARGKAVYESQCARCHGDTAVCMKTLPEEI
jgi:Ni,Fe-hydrogenase I small subunit